MLTGTKLFCDITRSSKSQHLSFTTMAIAIGLMACNKHTSYINYSQYVHKIKYQQLTISNEAQMANFSNIEPQAN